MFKSKARPIIFPQVEHARLAGAIAHLWGNDTIPAPAIEQLSFVLGVTHHDRGYDPLDTMPIGAVDTTTWLATQRRGILRSHQDPDADLVTLWHIRRLLHHTSREGTGDLIDLANEAINHRLQHSEHPRQAFEQADHITNLCDDIAFWFCYEKPRQFEARLAYEGGQITFDIALGSGGLVHIIGPWPLRVPEYSGFILGYRAQGYPDHLSPVMVPFHIVPAPA